MKRKRENGGNISVINYSNQFLTILNPTQNISVVSIKKDFEFSCILPPECCDNYPTKYHLTPLVFDNFVSKFVFSQKNYLYTLNVGDELTIDNKIKSRAAILSVISYQIANSFDWYIFTLTAHEKKFRLELRLSKNLEIIETLNISSFEDHIELLDIQFINDNISQNNIGIICLVYRINNNIKYALISFISKKLSILRHNSLDEKLMLNADNMVSCNKCWFFNEKSNITRVTWDPILLDLTFERCSDFDGTFFISYEIWGKYSSTTNSINIHLFKWPKFLLLNETFPTNDKITNIFGGINENDILLVLINSNNSKFQTIHLNTNNLNKISSAFQLKKVFESFNHDYHLNLNMNFDIANAKSVFKSETLKDEDAAILLLKDPEKLLPVFIESFNISPKHLIMAFKKHINQKSFDVLIRQLLKWLNSYNNDLEYDETSNIICGDLDYLIWIKKVVELTCHVLDSIVNTSINVDKIFIDELIKLTDDVCKLQKNLQQIYSRVITLTSASYFHDTRKYNSNKLFETLSICL